MSKRTGYTASLAWLFRQTRAGAPRDPERTRRLLDQLAVEQPARAVHIVGTNGKGSVGRLIAAGLQEAGYQVGHFSSPHVEDFRERVTIGGETVSEADVTEFISEARSLDTQCAFFEWSFAFALRMFARHAVDVMVVEAGVGAARDATMALQNVALSILTNISLDHQGALGPNVRAIAQDKAAVIRRGVPLITGVDSEDLLELLRSRALGSDAAFYALATGGPLFDLEPSLAASSEHERQNKQLASAALRLWNVPEPTLQTALRDARPLPARQEVFQLSDRTVVLDGAHNQAALQALLDATSGADVLLFGSQAKRDGKAFLKLLRPHFSQVFITSVKGERPEWMRPGNAYIHSPEQALSTALKACPAGGRLIITGSFYLAGELRPRLRKLRGRMGNDKEGGNQ